MSGCSCTLPVLRYCALLLCSVYFLTGPVHHTMPHTSSFYRSVRPLACALDRSALWPTGSRVGGGKQPRWGNLSDQTQCATMRPYSNCRRIAPHHRPTNTTPARPLPANCTSAVLLGSSASSNGGGVLSMRGLTSNSSISALETGRSSVERGEVSARRTVPDHIPKTPYYATGAVPPQDNAVSDLQHYGVSSLCQ